MYVCPDVCIYMLRDMSVFREMSRFPGPSKFARQGLGHINMSRSMLTFPGKCWYDIKSREISTWPKAIWEMLISKHSRLASDRFKYPSYILPPSLSSINHDNSELCYSNCLPGFFASIPSFYQTLGLRKIITTRLFSKMASVAEIKKKNLTSPSV